MKIAGYIFLIFILVLCQGCNKTDRQSAEIKLLDSLGGSLNFAVNALQKTDTIMLERAVARYSYYSKFIKENIKDTISKDQADNLQHFYSGGANLNIFLHNKNVLITRAALVNTQLLKLQKDLENEVDTKLLSGFIAKEQMEVFRLTESAQRQSEVYHRSLEEFRNALHGVETLIKSRNNGVLPTIIKDTIIL